MSYEEDQMIERALARLEGREATDEVSAEGLSAAAEECLREYTELSALLPFALDPVTPTDECRSSILREIGGELEHEQAPAPLSFPPPSTPAATSRPLRLLAAALTAAVLGLATFSGWLYQDNQRQTELIEEVRVALQEGQQRETTLQTTLAEVERLSALVTRIQKSEE